MIFSKNVIGNSLQRLNTHDFSEIITVELKIQEEKLPSGKVPSSDGIPELIIKEIAKSRPEILSNVFNSCQHTEFFQENGKLPG